ncbi:MAG: (5-formylfuran-3-yl)methyl phosphate synthase [Methylococcales bacterium]
MTRMLASVNSLKEAKLILNTTVDIIDLKQPEQGALGALSTKDVRTIVNAVNHQKLISATVGDLPMQADIVYKAVKAMAETGVDYIKIGFFPGGDWQGTLDKLSEISQQGCKLIAVLFADANPDINAIESFKQAGFYGVMLDTMNKANGSLLQVMDMTDIKQFVSQAKSAQLLCGLAGSLKQQDITELISLNPDYLGFRGALCQKNIRTSELDIDAINSILNFFSTPHPINKP